MVYSYTSTYVLIKCIYETNYRYMQQIFGDTLIILLTISQWDWECLEEIYNSDIYSQFNARIIIKMKYWYIVCSKPILVLWLSLEPCLHTCFWHKMLSWIPLSNETRLFCCWKECSIKLLRHSSSERCFIQFNWLLSKLHIMM